MANEPPSVNADDTHEESAGARCDTILQVDPYEKFHLTDAANQIRICKTQPGPIDSKLRISFQIINLDDNVDQYICLSYVWGDKDEVYKILLNGQGHAIHRNLHLQLLRLRANGVMQPVWCDALCINQDNVEERGTQVGMMDRIYKGAAQVFVCVDDVETNVLLRPSDDHASTLERALQNLANASHLDNLSCFALDDAGQTMGSAPYNCVANQFRRIINSSFFTRCWTVQEVVLAKDAVVVGEWGVIPWSLLVSALERYNHHRNDCCASFVQTLPKDVRSGCLKLFSHVLTLEHTKTQLQHGQHLIELLQSFGELQATEKKDKLLAFYADMPTIKANSKQGPKN